ncbi:hypothetical protein ACAW63_17405 [Pseudomonas sp. QE6]|uniref:hypothetical protein n=1 Tax=Pseudomonas sp. QE6 TaxID=3242491 RepID=UPI0035275D24
MPADPLCLVFVPPLVVLLTAAESRKRSPLTEDELCTIRDRAACIAVPFSAALETEGKRGYADIVAEDCWSEWRKLRARQI